MWGKLVVSTVSAFLLSSSTLDHHHHRHYKRASYNSKLMSTQPVEQLSEIIMSLSPSLQELVDTAKQLYNDKLNAIANNNSTQAWITTAPGRVNLIGEHTDYTQGYVFPLAIDYSTVVYGTAQLTVNKNDDNNDNNNPTTANLKFLSAKNPDKVEQVTMTANTQPPAIDDHNNWTWYVAGVVAEYLKDLPPTGATLDLTFAIAGNVPLGSGLSSSASLEVATARFVECALGDYAFASESSQSDVIAAKVRAIRCQRAENIWCHSPCGIMDQYISSAASSDEPGTLLCIDCRTNDFQVVKMKQDPTKPVVLVVANSAVTHSIGGGESEYSIRVRQCQEATRALQKVHGADRIQTLRDATVEDVLQCKEEMDDVIYRRARHVVTENARVLATKTAMEKGDWKTVGQQMSLSHMSMRDDYEVSCPEVDLLVELAQQYDDGGGGCVYGSRLTGGGFGGCTVTLIDKNKAPAFIDYLRNAYKAKTGKDCSPFETIPAPGARLLAVDTIHKA